MKIPGILFGSYNEVIKRLRPLKNHNIVFMKNFINEIQAPDKMMEVTFIRRSLYIGCGVMVYEKSSRKLMAYINCFGIRC